MHDSLGFLVLGLRGCGDRPGLVVHYLPVLLLADEDIGCDQKRAIDVFIADDEGAIATQEGLGTQAYNRRRSGIAEDRAPAFQHALAPDDRAPAGMDAGDGLVARPDLFHGSDIA